MIISSTSTARTPWSQPDRGIQALSYRM